MEKYPPPTRNDSAQKRNCQAEILHQTGLSICGSQVLLKKHIEGVVKLRQAKKWQTIETD